LTIIKSLPAPTACPWSWVVVPWVGMDDRRIIPVTAPIAAANLQPKANIRILFLNYFHPLLLAKYGNPVERYHGPPAEGAARFYSTH
jgi:hypothetical protein